MLKIRLKRIGRKGQPSYRVVIIESTKPRNSRAVAEVGFYNPRTKPSTVQLDTDSIQQWMKNGAQPSETVAQLLVKAGVLKGLHRGSTKPQPKKKKKESAENAA